MDTKCLENRICLVTGASRGIGRAIVEAYAGEGAIVYAGVRDQDKDYSFPNNVTPILLDLEDDKSIISAVKTIKSDYGRLDVLVNNAGIVSNEPLGMISKDMLRHMFEVNVFGMLDLSQMIATRFMIKQKSGSIINMASIVGVKGCAGQVAYSASKGAVISSTYSMAKELAGYNIRVNAIAPGIIETERVHDLLEKEYSESSKRILMERIGSPSDVAKVCVMLASDMTEYMTGQVVSVDGCMII